MLDNTPVHRSPLIPSQQDSLITGGGAGKPVYITPQAKPIYDELLKLARRNNYWAVTTVRGINELVAGRLNMNNIFVHPGCPKRYGREEFVVVLPGCKVTAEKLENGSYKLLCFEADLNYFDLAENGQKAGLYEVEKDDNVWKLEYKRRGKIKNEKNRLVAISDGGHRSNSRAASNLASVVASAPMSGGSFRVDPDGFDMHYTPSEKRLGGLRNYKKAARPLDYKELNESALLLASTMAGSRDQKGVAWITELGGCAILTQALKILVDQNVVLDGHTMYLYEPTTSPNETIKLAQSVGLKFDRSVNKVGFLNYMGNRDQLELIGNRFKHEKGYGVGKASADVAKQIGTLQGGMAAVGALVGASLATAGVSISGPALPAAIAYLATVAGASVAMLKATSTVAEQVAPKLHSRIKSKF